MTDLGPRLLQLKMLLRDVHPAVWRRVRLGDELSIAELHRVIQILEGSDDDHAWLAVGPSKDRGDSDGQISLAFAGDTGNFNVPIAAPAGRNGFQPKLELVYSTGAGNGSFGLGWWLPIPRVARKTQPVPRFRDAATNLAEDLVPLSPLADAAGRTAARSRPRTEGAVGGWVDTAQQ